MTTVTIGTRTLAEFLDESTDFTGFYFNELEDWYSVPQSKAQNTPRPNAHGSFGGGPDYREGAVVTVKGGFVGIDEAAALQEMDDLKLDWAQGTQLQITVDTVLGPTSRTVSIRFLTIPDHHGRSRFEFTVDVFARDPLRYGPAVGEHTVLPVIAGGLVWPITWPITWAGGGSDGRIILNNTGNADTLPRMLEVTGGLSLGFTIDEVGTGRQIRFERLVPLGSTIFLNPRTERAYIDAPGNDVSGFLTRSDWPTVPRRGQTVLQFNALGEATNTIDSPDRVNPFNNPSGRRALTGYSLFGAGTLGLDVPAGLTYDIVGAVLGIGSAGILIEAMTVGGKLLPNTTYTFSLGAIGGTGVATRAYVGGTGVVGAGVVGATVPPSTSAPTSVTFTTTASGTVSLYVLNAATTAIGNVIYFHDAIIDPGATPLGYFDGSTPDTYDIVYGWADAADNSVSTRSHISARPTLTARTAPAYW